jgi:hypothetical protein
MKNRKVLPFLFLYVSLLLPYNVSCQADPAQDVSAVVGENYIIINVAGKEFTRYLFGEQHKYPFFYPVNGPKSGESITTWDQTPYPHHSSLFIGIDWISSESVERGNYWQPRHNLQTGQVFSRNARIVEQTAKKVVLEDNTEWIVPRTGTHHFTENRKVTVWAPSASLRIMDFEFTFIVSKDLEISRPTGHSFFSARVNPEIAVGDTERAAEWAHLGTGQIVDSEGDLNEEGIREKSTPWAAYSGQHHGVTEGLAILQHPSNSFYPAQWVIRDYGFISPSPFAFIDAPLQMHKGDIHSYKYRVIIFEGIPADANLPYWYDDFIKL